MKQNNIVFKYLGILILIFLITACNINFNFSSDDDYYDYYDYNQKYIEEENKRKEEEEKKKEIERQKKILSRNYIDETFNPYFALLNDEEKQVYYDILENANNFYNEFFDLTNRVSVDKLHEIFIYVKYDNPELIWLKTYLYYSDSDTNEAYSIILLYYDKDNFETENIVMEAKTKNTIAINDYKVKINEFNSIVDNIVIEANNYQSILEKEKFVHDLLINRIVYDINMQKDQSAYGALVYNKAVCAGYTKAFQLIMRKLNIPTYYISGEGRNHNNEVEKHAWNLILLDGEYYNVDLTWDDPIDIYYGRNLLEYTYFNVSDDFLNKNHTRTEFSINLPYATGGKYSNIYN